MSFASIVRAPFAAIARSKVAAPAAGVIGVPMWVAATYMREDANPDNDGAGLALVASSALLMGYAGFRGGQRLTAAGSAAGAAQRAGQQASHVGKLAVRMQAHPILSNLGIMVVESAALGGLTALGGHLAGNGKGVPVATTDEIIANANGQLQLTAAHDGTPIPDRGKVADLVRANDSDATHGARAGDGKMTNDDVVRVQRALMDDSWHRLPQS